MTPSAPLTYRVPALVKRNTALFALSQCFTGAGMQFAYGLGPLMVMAVSHSAGLAGLSVALISFSRFLVAYPTGKITDVLGRKPGVLFGLALALVGALGLGLSVVQHSFALLVGSMLLFGMGMNAAQQLRVAATDMFPPSMRAQALGYVALGSLVGLAFSPAVISFGENLSHRTGNDPLALPWFMLPLLILPGMAAITLARPDPKTIGADLQRYYPDYAPPPARLADASTFRVRDLLALRPTRLAIAFNSAAQANMSVVMVLTSLTLAHHGHSLSAIAMSHVFHSAGMFAFTIPLGRIADRYGRMRTMVPGVLVALVGAALTAFTEAYATITIGTFLVGLGWAAANVAATALVADHAPTHHRGRAIGVNDSFAGGVSLVMALIVGPVVEQAGLSAAGWVAIAVSIAPFLLLPTSRRAPIAADLERAAF